MRRIFSLFPLFALFSCCALVASAQFSVSAGGGAGYVWNKANGQGILSADAPVNPFGSCTPSAGNPFCLPTSGLDVVLMRLDGDVMVTKQFGLGGQLDFQPYRKDYGPLQFRQTFYDFNGIWAPFTSKHAVFRLEGGIGGSHTGFYFTQSGCIGTAVCSSATSSVGSANHFDVHFGGGVMLFLSSHIYVKPMIDVHYVPGFTDQFNSNLTPSAMFTIGYSSSER